ncbi:homoserine dehydrogenase [Acidisoma cellulosilytica]|uniref:Homoserine dehydrogenase n=1 Tax=Acidisoma cellulosilyticum TaxID=2802395 RepID=A0A963Z3X3_9PROT|nr:homoserine dehydrogenase [Acidisoma cellulosilyticum]MCB8881570.1 homoserine dehydrogenase [Acidisoma cellulosilyticum]
MSDPHKPLRVGIAGLGTVGAGTVNVLRQNAAIISARAGRPITVTAVSARDRTRDRGFATEGLIWHDDAVALATDDNVDVVVEVIGGAQGPAADTVRAAIRAGKPVVTANKALLALHGAELASLAEEYGVPLGFEAAVAGGIPAIKALREGLAANEIISVSGILNGTCNYILTVMREQGRDFAEVLADAQAFGYAEADPAFDIDGVDAAHKLAILGALAFGQPVDFAALHVEGIRRITALDIAFARELGFRIKLLGIAKRTADGVSMRVHPTMVPEAEEIAQVDGVFNAVVAEGNFVGRVMLMGRGAGAGPTASAVVADLIDIARGRLTPIWGVEGYALGKLPALPMSAHQGAYYLRLMVRDRSGVMADVTAVLRDAGVSLQSMLQHGRAPGESVPIVLVTHETTEGAMMQALSAIANLDSVLEPPALIRIGAA